MILAFFITIITIIVIIITYVVFQYFSWFNLFCQALFTSPGQCVNATYALFSGPAA